MKHMIPVAQSVLVVVAVGGWLHLSPVAASEPIDVESFFVTPNQPSVLRWKVAEGELTEPVEYKIRDYGSAPVKSGQAGLAAGNTLEVSVVLGPGFYEIEFPGTKERFGVVSLPTFSGQRDPFFCIDSALSWLVRDDAVREGLLRVLHRCGVAMSRERFSWAGVNPAAGSFDWAASARYETVRRLHAQCGVEVLEMCHDAPSWCGRVGKYPADLVQAGASLRQIARRWRSTWGALEFWNEPDIFFGANLPADQYVTLVKALAHAVTREAPDLPLVGGVMAHHNRPFLDTAAQNGLLGLVDAVSFHTYGRAPSMEGLVGDYRSWLRAHGHEAMPLWITECGRPWAQGPDRPPADQDAQSALDITMKAIEARGSGVARYFAFVYPFYEEHSQNFGMMGRRGTPLRSMAAYARLTALLAHKQYLGDLRCEDSSIQRARVFGHAEETVAVIYTGRPDPAATVRVRLPALRAEGIDGRRLDVADDGTVAVPDGLVYLWLDGDKLAERLLTDVPTRRLWSLGQEKPPRRRPATAPIVMRFQADPERLDAKTEGYRFRAAVPRELPVQVRVFNLADEPAELTLRMSCDPQGARVAGPDSLQVKVPAAASADAQWKLDLGEAFAVDGPQTVRVTAGGKAVGDVAPLVVELHGEAAR